MKKRSSFDKFIFVLHFILGLLLLLACIVPYTTSASFSFLSLVVPLLVIFNLFFLMYWLIIQRRLLWFSLIALVTGYFTLGSFVHINFKDNQKGNDDLRVMSYNAFGFHGYWNYKAPETPQKVVDFITIENPDIICFQEYGHKINKTNVRDAYPYRYIDGGYKNGESRVVQAIYSKYPIVNEGVLNFPESSNHAIYADVAVASDTIRVYNLHLQSLSIRPGMVKKERSDRLFRRLRKSFAKQHEQALIFRKNAEECPYGKIVCVDLNNTQFSSAYRIIKGGMSDSFQEAGSGYGKTINFWRFPLRIDFILADSEFKILGHNNYSIGHSDHEPVMASFKLSSDQ